MAISSFDGLTPFNLHRHLAKDAATSIPNVAFPPSTQTFSREVEEISFNFNHDDDCGIRFNHLIRQLKRASKTILQNPRGSLASTIRGLAEIAKNALESQFPKDPVMHFLGAFQFAINLPQHHRALTWQALNSSMNLTIPSKKDTTFCSLLHALLKTSLSAEGLNIEASYAILNVLGIFHLNTPSSLPSVSTRNESLSTVNNGKKAYLLIHLVEEEQALTLHIPLDAEEALEILNKKIKNSFDLPDPGALARLVKRLAPPLKRTPLALDDLRSKLEMIGFNPCKWEKAALSLVDFADPSLSFLGMRLIFLKNLVTKVENCERILTRNLPKIIDDLEPHEHSEYVVHFNRIVQLRFGAELTFGLLDIVGKNYQQQKLVQLLIENLQMMPIYSDLAIELFCTYAPMLTKSCYGNLVELGIKLFKTLQTEPQLIAGFKALTRLAYARTFRREHLLQFYCSAKITFSKQEIGLVTRTLFIRMHRTIATLLEGVSERKDTQMCELTGILRKNLSWICRNLHNQKDYLNVNEILLPSLKADWLSFEEPELLALSVDICKQLEDHLESVEAGELWLQYALIFHQMLRKKSCDPLDKGVYLSAQTFVIKIQEHLGLLEAVELWFLFNESNRWKASHTPPFLHDFAVFEIREARKITKSRVTHLPLNQAYSTFLQNTFYQACLYLDLTKDTWLSAPLHARLFESLRASVALDHGKTSWTLVKRHQHHLSTEERLALYRTVFESHDTPEEQQQSLQGFLGPHLGKDITLLIKYYAKRLAQKLLAKNKGHLALELIEQLSNHKIEWEETRLLIKVLNYSLEFYDPTYNRRIQKGLQILICRIGDPTQQKYSQTFEETLDLLLKAFSLISTFEDEFIIQLEQMIVPLLAALQEKQDLQKLETLSEHFLNLRPSLSVPPCLHNFMIFIVETMSTVEPLEDKRLDLWCERLVSCNIPLNVTEKVLAAFLRLACVYAQKNDNEKLLYWLKKLHTIRKTLFLSSEFVALLDQRQQTLICEKKYEEADIITDFVISGTNPYIGNQKLLACLVRSVAAEPLPRLFLAISLKYASEISRSPLYKEIQGLGFEIISKSIRSGIPEDELACIALFMATFCLIASDFWLAILKKITTSKNAKATLVICKLFEKGFEFDKAFGKKASSRAACWTELVTLFFTQKRYTFLLRLASDAKAYEALFAGVARNDLQQPVRTTLTGCLRAFEEDLTIPPTENQILSMTQIAQHLNLEIITIEEILIPLIKLASAQGQNAAIFDWSKSIIFGLFKNAPTSHFVLKLIDSIGDLMMFWPQYVDEKTLEESKIQMSLLTKIFIENCKPHPSCFIQAVRLLSFQSPVAVHQSSDLFSRTTKALMTEIPEKSARHVREHKENILLCLLTYFETPQDHNIVQHLEFIRFSSFKKATTTEEFIRVSEAAIRTAVLDTKIDRHKFVVTLFNLYFDYLASDPKSISARKAATLSYVNLEECKRSGDEQLFLRQHKEMFLRLLKRPSKSYLEIDLDNQHPLLVLLSDLFCYLNKGAQKTTEVYNTVQINLRELLVSSDIDRENLLEIFITFIYSLHFSQSNSFNFHINCSRKIHAEVHRLNIYKTHALTHAEIHLILWLDFPRPRECPLTEEEKTSAFRNVIRRMDREKSLDMVLHFFELLERNHSFLFTNRAELLFLSLERLLHVFKEKENLSHLFFRHFINRMTAFLFTFSQSILEKLILLDFNRTKKFLNEMFSTIIIQAKTLTSDQKESQDAFKSMLDFCVRLLIVDAFYQNPKIKLSLISNIFDLSLVPYIHLEDFPIFIPVYEVLLEFDVSNATLKAFNIEIETFKKDYSILLKRILGALKERIKIRVHRKHVLGLIPSIKQCLQKLAFEHNDILSMAGFELKELEQQLTQLQSKDSKTKQ